LSPWTSGGAGVAVGPHAINSQAIIATTSMRIRVLILSSMG
jgi:hypothetical protein